MLTITSTLSFQKHFIMTYSDEVNNICGAQLSFQNNFAEKGIGINNIELCHGPSVCSIYINILKVTA